MPRTEPPPVRIETERLVLRPPQPGDEDAIYRGINDFDVVRMLAAPPWPYLPEHAEWYVAQTGKRDPERDIALAIVHRQHGLIGMTGFHPSDGEPFPEFGYWVARRHWGQGYATEAARAALRWAREHWGKRAIRAGHFVENQASGRVLVKAGMLYTGVVAPQHCAARGEAVPSRKMIWLA
jgi:RimJ/RimL family protein N-acetyltransferase